MSGMPTTENVPRPVPLDQPNRPDPYRDAVAAWKRTCDAVIGPTLVECARRLRSAGWPAARAGNRLDLVPRIGHPHLVFTPDVRYGRVRTAGRIIVSFEWGECPVEIVTAAFVRDVVDRFVGEAGRRITPQIASIFEREGDPGSILDR